MPLLTNKDLTPDLTPKAAARCSDNVDASASPSYPWGFALRLGLLGFLTNCKPSEPYLTAYLLVNKQLSEEQLETDVWPYSTWGSFFFLLPVGLLADELGSRTVIFGGLLFREATRLLLIFGEGVPAMASMQLTYSVSVSVDAIYFAYVYAAAPPEHFLSMTSAVHGAYHAGNVVGSLAGEAWVRAGGALTPLFYFSLFFVSLSLVAFVALPAPLAEPPPSLASMLRKGGVTVAARSLCSLSARDAESIDLARESVPHADGESAGVDHDHADAGVGPSEATNGGNVGNALCWLCWWVCGFSARMLAGNYFQLQIAGVSRDAPFGLLEAAIEAALVIGALLATAASRLVRERQKLALVLSSGLAALLYALCAVGAQASSLVLPLAGNVAASALFSLQYAVGCVCLAEALPSSRYPLLFALYGFFSLASASVLQSIGTTLSLDANGYYFLTAVLQLMVPVAIGGATLRSSLFSLYGRGRRRAFSEPGKRLPSETVVENEGGHV